MKKYNTTITKKELRSIVILSLIFACRMSGIFMILPVLTIYAASLKEVNEYLIGVAIGIYGVMQIIFQLPFGLMSDRIGYKTVIIGGLIIFACGSEIAAVTDNIWGLIIGRAIQGSGAISSSMISLLLESVQETNRTKAMAIVGSSFGATFAISIILGPIITNIFGLHGLFQSITVLSVLAILLTYIALPSISCSATSREKKKTNLLMIFKNVKKIFTYTQLIKLNCYILYLHAILMLNFIVSPKIITYLGFDPSIHWKIYSIIIVISACIVLPYIFFTNTQQKTKNTLIIFANILFLSELLMLISRQNQWIFLVGLQFFFIAFNLIETILPACISKIAPKAYKSTTISIYSIGQFLGISIGGILGGFISEIQGSELVLCFALLIAIICIITCYTLKK